MTSQSTSRVSSNGSKDKPWRAFTLASVLIAFSITSRPSSAEWFGEAQPHMGTEISVYLWHDDPEIGAKAVAAVFTEVARLDRLMSTYIEDSRISEINRDAATRPVEAGDELFGLILRSLDIAVLTRGAFDITMTASDNITIFAKGGVPTKKLSLRSFG